MSLNRSLNEGRIQPDDGYDEYHVVWEIDVSAQSAHEAAQFALEIQRDPESIATVFHVTGPEQDTFVRVIDLEEEDS